MIMQDVDYLQQSSSFQLVFLREQSGFLGRQQPQGRLVVKIKVKKIYIYILAIKREFLRGPKEKKLAHASEFENLHISFRDTLWLANKGVTIFFVQIYFLFYKIYKNCNGGRTEGNWPKLARKIRTTLLFKSAKGYQLITKLYIYVGGIDN